MALIAQGLLIGVKILLQSLFAVDKTRRTKVLGNIVQSHVLKVESLIFIISCIMHCALRLCIFWIGVSVCILRKIERPSIAAAIKAAEYQQGKQKCRNSAKHRGHQGKTLIIAVLADHNQTIILHSQD